MTFAGLLVVYFAFLPAYKISAGILVAPYRGGAHDFRGCLWKTWKSSDRSLVRGCLRWSLLLADTGADSGEF